ncbi:hypothetical protein CDD83_2393 [Cordyceps sp. RAO-2017]|nr:hypothetical protein CDD83_2393 [Cordyceps sp. RAO-2017]
MDKPDGKARGRQEDTSEGLAAAAVATLVDVADADLGTDTLVSSPFSSSSSSSSSSLSWAAPQGLPGPSGCRRPCLAWAVLDSSNAAGACPWRGGEERGVGEVESRALVTTQAWRAGMRRRDGNMQLCTEGEVPGSDDQLAGRGQRNGGKGAVGRDRRRARKRREAPEEDLDREPGAGQRIKERKEKGKRKNRGGEGGRRKGESHVDLMTKAAELVAGGVSSPKYR